jgi:VEFS-Box of polycomb protein
MSIWNEYMRNNPIISEIQLSSQLISFIEANGKCIFENSLEAEWIMHITNMWVEGQVRRETMLHSMRIYNALIENVHSNTT